MRFFANILGNPLQLVTYAGGNEAITTASFKRRDTRSVELKLFEEEVPDAEGVQFAPSTEIRFGCKKQSAITSNIPVIAEVSFAWDEDLQLYQGNPSINTIQLDALFLDALSSRVISASSYTAVAADKNLLIACTHGTAATITIPPSFLADGDYLFVEAAGLGTATVVGGSGVTITPIITDNGELELPLITGRVVKLTRVSATAWNAEIPDELSEVELKGEFSLRALSPTGGWVTTETITVKVSNDILRGDEGAPTNMEELSLFYTKDEVDASLALKANAADVYTQEETDDLLDAKAAASSLTALDGVVIKKTGTTLTGGEKTIVLEDIGAEPILADLVTAQPTADKPLRLAWNAKGRITGSVARIYGVRWNSASITASTADLLGVQLTIPANSLSPGKCINYVVYGASTNGTTASTLRGYVEVNGTKYGPVSFAMGTTAASNVPFCARGQMIMNGGDSVFMQMEFLWKATSGVMPFANVNLDLTVANTIQIVFNVTVATGTSVTVNYGSIELDS